MFGALGTQIQVINYWIYIKEEESEIKNNKKKKKILNHLPHKKLVHSTFTEHMHQHSLQQHITGVPTQNSIGTNFIKFFTETVFIHLGA